MSDLCILSLINLKLLKAKNRLTWSLAWQGRGGGGEWITGYFSKNNRAIQLLAGPLAPQRWGCSNFA
jgi:hypothetical protein